MAFISPDTLELLWPPAGTSATLPNALPGTPQWVSPFLAGTNGQTKLRIAGFSGIAAATITLHLVPPGGAAGAGNIRIPAMAIAAGEVIDVYHEDGEFTIPAGYSIYMFASVASAVNAFLSGSHVSGG